MRLFIGMPVPPHAAIRDVTATLRERIPSARPVPDGSCHVTLRFLGDVDDPQPVIAALQDALTHARASPGRIVGVGAFPNSAHATVLWAGIAAPGVEIVAQRVVAATSHIGGKLDNRTFVPHLTLARLRTPRDIRPELADLASLDLGPAPLDEVALLESRLGPDGPRYTALHRFPLQLAQPHP